MKVLIFGKGIPFFLPLPSRILFSRGAAKLVGRITREADVPLTPEQTGRIMETLRQCRRDFPRLVLVDLKTEDGQRIKVTL